MDISNIENDKISIVLGRNKPKAKSESDKYETDDIIDEIDCEQEYKKDRQWFDIVLIILCCMFLFSTAFAKATPKDTQNSLPEMHAYWKNQTMYANDNSLSIFPQFTTSELNTNIMSAIAWLEFPVIFIAPVKFLHVLVFLVD